MKADTKKSIAVDSKGNTWVFFIGDGNRLCYMVKRGKEEASGNHLEPGRGIKEFFMDLDDQDNIHLVALTVDKKVVYMRYNMVEWNKHVLYSFSGTSNEISNLYLASGDGEIHLLYLLSDGVGNSVLFHHRWNGKKWAGFKVKSFSKGGNPLCYDMCMGNNGSALLVLSTGEDVELWKFDTDNWTRMGCRRGHGCTGVKDIIFQEDYLVLINDYGVHFIKNVERLDETEPVEVVSGTGIEKGPIIVNRKKTLHVSWGHNGQIKYRSSYDGGGSWSREKQYNNMKEKEFEVYRFINSFTPLVKAKRVIATKPAEMHIPFLHRPMEKVRFPADFTEVKGSIPSVDNRISVPPVDNRMSVERPENIQDSGITLKQKKEHDPPKDDEGGSPDRIDYNDRIDRLTEDIRGSLKDEVSRMREDLGKYYQELSNRFEKRVKRLEEEVEVLKKKAQEMDTGRRADAKPVGNVITQEMINECLRKKRK